MSLDSERTPAQTSFPNVLAEVRTFRARYPDVRHVDLISLDIPGHFYGKRYPIDMLEKVAAGSPLKLPQNAVLLGTQGGLFQIGDYCFNDGDPDAPRRLAGARHIEACHMGSAALGADADQQRRNASAHRIRAS